MLKVYKRGEPKRPTFWIWAARFAVGLLHVAMLVFVGYHVYSLNGMAFHLTAIGLGIYLHAYFSWRYRSWSV